MELGVKGEGIAACRGLEQKTVLGNFYEPWLLLAYLLPYLLIDYLACSNVDIPCGDQGCNVHVENSAC